MSTKEMAYSILNQFSEEELKRFVAYFGVIYPIQKQETELSEKQKVFQELSCLIKHIPDINEKNELKA